MITINTDYNDFSEKYREALNSVLPQDLSDFSISILDKEKCNGVYCNVFGCNPILKHNNIYEIAYDPEKIIQLGLDKAEQHALILHEIGHIVLYKTQPNYTFNETDDFNAELKKEMFCDDFSRKICNPFVLLSSLTKLHRECDDFQLKLLSHRKTHILRECRIYRPIWTCGQYHVEKRVAIYYNLIEGLSYFFEEDSADVMGKILQTKRGNHFTIEELTHCTGLQGECLIPFIQLLVSKNLLSLYDTNSCDIKGYRNCMVEVRRNHVIKEEETLREMTVVSTTDAERQYMERVGDVCSVMLELTYRCSEMCIHCYNAGASRNPEEKSKRGERQELCLGEYKRVIDELYEKGLFKVCLTGGDPFSKDIVWDIMQYLYDKEIAFDVFTNGISVTDKVDRLASLYPRTLGISLYSDIPSVHDSITRIKGSHDRTIAFIQQCSGLAIPMLLKCCIMRNNVKSYYTIKDVARKYGALPQFDINITDSVEGDKCASTYLRLDHEAMEIVLRDKDLVYYVGEGELPKPVLDPNGKMCNAGIESICITPEGNLQPCCAFPMKIGNVRDGNVCEVLSSSRTLVWWRSKTLADCEECHQHDYCVFCQMCAGNNYIAHGTPLKPSDNNCYIAKERFELARKMQDGYDPLKHKTLEERLAELEIEIPQLQHLHSTNYRDKIRINGMSD